MTDYSKFSVHDLLCEALALQERERLMGDREPFTDAMQTEIESALRKAVIREATVGRLEIVHAPAIHAALATKRLKAAFDIADDVLLQGDIEAEGKWATHPPATTDLIDETLREIFPEGTYRLVLEDERP